MSVQYHIEQHSAVQHSDGASTTVLPWGSAVPKSQAYIYMLPYTISLCGYGFCVLVLAAYGNFSSRSTVAAISIPVGGKASAESWIPPLEAESPLSCVAIH